MMGMVANARSLGGGGGGFPIQSSTWHSRLEHYCSTSIVIASPSHMHAYNIKVWLMRLWATQL